MPPSTPTARGHTLGHELRKLRAGHDLSTQKVANRLGWSQSKVSRIETGKQGVRPSDVGLLLDLYGVDSKTRAGLIEMAQNAQQHGWWVPYGDVFTGSYIAIEDVADKIRDYETILIPGLLQTGRYARAVIEAGRPAVPGEVDRRVRARRARQDLLDRTDAPKLVAVIYEAALRCPIGGPEVMREQLRALIQPERENVTVLVLPFAAGAHAGLDGPFTILSFEGDAPDIAFAETAVGDAYEESAEGTRKATLRFKAIQELALSAKESAAFIAALIKE